MKHILRSLLKVTFISRLLVLLRLDYMVSRLRNNWAGKTLDAGKNPEQNMGFSERPGIQEARARVHAEILKVYEQYCAGGAVLDVGCGVGLGLGYFPDTVTCHGADVSGNFLDSARNRLPKAVFHHGDYLTLSFTQPFSLIYSVSVLQYIPPSLIKSLVTKLSKDLVPGGIVLLQYPHALSAQDARSPDLDYVLYSPNFLVGQFQTLFEIISHTHAFDGRKMDFDYDDTLYDPEMGRSFRNGSILVCRKK